MEDPEVIEEAAAEAAAQPLETEASFRLLFDSNPLPMWICEAETLGIVAANKAARRAFGYSRSEFLGLTFRHVCLNQELPSLLANPKLVREQEAHLTASWKQTTKDGSVLDVELTWNRIDFLGRPSILILSHDITERRRAERRSAEQASLLDLARDAIMVRNLDGKILFWNKGAEGLYGWTSHETIGRDGNDILPWEEKEFERARATVIEEGQWSGEVKQVTKAGNTITVNSRWTLVLDDERKPKSFLVINTDITEKKNLETQFLRGQRLESIGTLASGIAHDLNNILTPILMSTGILLRTVTDPGNQKLLSTIEGSAERGADIVKQVLTFARGVEGDRASLQPRLLVTELTKIMGQTFPRNINIKNRLPKDLWWITGDSTQLHQVLLNLCVNARDAMPDGGTLTVAAENAEFSPAEVTGDARPGPYVILKVSDTGSGIPPAVIERIFDPFFTTKEQGKGTGLGLSTVVGIVKSHFGFMTVESAIGKGTTFHICLPATPKLMSDESVQEKTETPVSNGELILIVDDEPSIREAAVQTLEAHGYRVYTAEDGTDALALYFQRRNEIQLVLTDLAMDLMDGVALIRALKRVEPHCKVIVSSGHGDGGHRETLDGLGVRHYLDKPYTATQLIAKIHEVVTDAEAPAGT